MYMNKFFRTKEEAVSFQKEQGFGALYSNEKGSRTKGNYNVAVVVVRDEFQKEHPFCVAWNHQE